MAGGLQSGATRFGSGEALTWPQEALYRTLNASVVQGILFNFSLELTLKAWNGYKVFARICLKNTKRSVPIVSWTHSLWVQMDYHKKQHCFKKKNATSRLHAFYWSKCTSHKFVYQMFVTNPQIIRYQTVRKSILK